MKKNAKKKCPEVAPVLAVRETPSGAGKKIKKKKKQKKSDPEVAPVLAVRETPSGAGKTKEKKKSDPEVAPTSDAKVAAASEPQPYIKVAPTPSGI
jgi:hypothetical protein